VNALTGYQGYLVAAGKFTTTGSGNANRIAYRNMSIGIDEINENILSADFFPNPVIENAVLKFVTKTVIHEPVLKITDLNGREINPDNKPVLSTHAGNEIEFRINRSGLPSGVYFYQMSDDTQPVAAGRFVVE